MGSTESIPSTEAMSSVPPIKSGFLHIYSNNSHKTVQEKWVTFQRRYEGSSEYLLNIYPNKKEKKRKQYMIHAESFIGIEEGNMGNGETRYFTVFYKGKKIIFQTKNREEAHSWCEMFKKHFKCEKWNVHLMDSEDAEESSPKMTPYLLHVTPSAVSLTKFNPSEMYKLWSIRHIKCVENDQEFLNIGVMGAASDSGYYQIKPSNSNHLSHIKEAIDRQRKVTKETEDVEKDQYLEHTPGKEVSSGTMIPDVATKVDGEDEFQTSSRPVSSSPHTRYPDVIIDTESKPNEGNKTVKLDETKAEFIRDGVDADTEEQASYQNAVQAAKLSPRQQRPPALPMKDHIRHFKSETIGETIEAIRAKKHCFRDSLGISPGKRTNLNTRSDATGWWKDLAESIGFNAMDIDVVDTLAPSLSKSWTEIVIYHWECTRSPQRICNIQELENIARETGREDILTILTEE